MSFRKPVPNIPPVLAITDDAGTNTLTATYTGPAYTNVPMTATDTSTIVLGDTAYTHDANGNLIGDATFTYQYDTANQLTNVIRKSDSVSVLQCRYDALGRRVEAIRSDGTVDRYVYFPGSFLVLAVLDETNAPKEFYTRGPDLSGTLDSAGGIGGILACTYSSGPVLYHHADLMGNIIALTDTSSTLVSSFRYTPLGQLIVHFGSILSRHLFSSKEFEKAVFLYCYGLRTYSPTLARWLTRDPIGERGGMNVYQYCNNNAVEYIDWIGLSESLSTMPIIRDDASQAAPGELYWNPDMPGNEGTTADSLSSLLSNMNSSHIRLSGAALEAVKSESRIYVISSLMDQLDCCHGEEGPASIPIHYDDWPQYGATSLLEVIGDFVENQQTATSWTVGSGHLRCSGNASITRVPCPTSDPCACETRGVVKLKCNLQDEFDYQYDPSRGGVYNFGAILISQVIKRSVFVNTNWEDKFLIRRKFNCGRKQ